MEPETQKKVYIGAGVVGAVALVSGIVWYFVRKKPGAEAAPALTPGAGPSGPAKAPAAIQASVDAAAKAGADAKAAGPLTKPSQDTGGAPTPPPVLDMGDPKVLHAVRLVTAAMGANWPSVKTFAAKILAAPAADEWSTNENSIWFAAGNLSKDAVQVVGTNVQPTAAGLCTLLSWINAGTVSLAGISKADVDAIYAALLPWYVAGCAGAGGVTGTLLPLPPTLDLRDPKTLRAVRIATAQLGLTNPNTIASANNILATKDADVWGSDENFIWSTANEVKKGSAQLVGPGAGMTQPTPAGLCSLITMLLDKTIPIGNLSAADAKATFDALAPWYNGGCVGTVTGRIIPYPSPLDLSDPKVIRAIRLVTAVAALAGDNAMMQTWANTILKDAASSTWGAPESALWSTNPGGYHVLHTVSGQYTPSVSGLCFALKQIADGKVPLDRLSIDDTTAANAALLPWYVGGCKAFMGTMLA
jgi:hypothetical protein